MGTNSLISGHVEAGKIDDANNSIVHTIILTLISSIVILIGSIFFLNDLIRLSGASSAITCPN